jgi:hypothetical protein
MMTKKMRKKMDELNFDVVESYLKTIGWYKTDFVPKNKAYSVWHKKAWAEEERNNLQNSERRCDEAEIMLPHDKSFVDYGRRMAEVFITLSIIYDKCACELLNEVLA